MMIYFKWMSFAFLNLFYTAFAWLFAPVIARYVDENWNLPASLKNYQTPDAYMNGKGTSEKGGDKGFYQSHLGKDPIQVARKWMRRNTYHGGRAYKWGISYGSLIVANVLNSNYFVYEEKKRLGECIRKSGAMTFDERSGKGHFLYHFISEGKIKAFMYYANFYFSLPFLGQKRLRLKLGWDLWSMYWPKDVPRMFVCSIGIHKIKE